MVRVIVEREFEQPVTFEEIQEQETRKISCLKLRGVRFVQSFFSHDRRRMICEYDAPDAESVREAQTRAGMPFTRVWAAKVL